MKNIMKREKNKSNIKEILKKKKKNKKDLSFKRGVYIS